MSEYKGNSNDYVLQIEDLTIHFEVDGEVIEAVNHVNLTLEHKKMLGLVGETGAGKTTTALAILKLVQTPPGVIKSGRILVDGKDVYAAGKKELEGMRGNDVAMIFQDPMTVLNPVFTVGEQIAECVEIHEHCGKHRAMERAREDG